MKSAATGEAVTRSRYRYMVGIVDFLRRSGDRGSAAAVYAWLELEGIADKADLQTIQTDGGTRFRKEVRWARKELFDAGYLGAAAPGQWSLTEKASGLVLTVEMAQTVVRENTRVRRRGQNRARTAAAPAFTWRADFSVSQSSGPTTGPKPSDWSGTVQRAAAISSSTYVMQFASRDIWKIGHASDLIGRLGEINKHVPSEITGEAWVLVARYELATATDAYEMEQTVLGELSQYRTVGERIQCNERIIRDAWEGCIARLNGKQIA